MPSHVLKLSSILCQGKYLCILTEEQVRELVLLENNSIKVKRENKNSFKKIYFPMGGLPNSLHAFARREWHGAENKCLCRADPLVLQPIARSALSIQDSLIE